MILVNYSTASRMRYYFKGENYLRWLKQGLSIYTQEIKEKIVLRQLIADLNDEYPAAVQLRNLYPTKTLQEIVNIIL